MKIAAVSDVTLGYGTPQLPLLVESLQRHYGGSAHLVEPAQPELAPRHSLYPWLDVRRVATGEHPHAEAGRNEYIWRAAKAVNEIAPDVLVICCTYSLPVALKLKRRPRKIFYYSVESIQGYGAFDIEVNRRAAAVIDVILFPEENRAVIETGRCGFHSVPKLILYNVSNHAGELAPPLDRSRRNGRILYSGTISVEQTFANYYLSEKLRGIPIDMFGPVKEREGEKGRFLASLHGDVHYGGYLSGPELAERRRPYLYSLVAWNPGVENQLYAAPNKLFESIAAGVPPIAAPHPQCKLILERYGCGLLMPDWSFEGFVASLRRAMELYGSADWDAMVRNCVHAVEKELNWEAQFAKLRPYL